MKFLALMKKKKKIEKEFKDKIKIIESNLSNFEEENKNLKQDNLSLKHEKLKINEEIVGFAKIEKFKINISEKCKKFGSWTPNFSINAKYKEEVEKKINSLLENGIKSKLEN